MKKFIKHLRKKWLQYGLETFVVVNGVLIAFLVNSWNETQKDRKEEIKILSALHAEITENQKQIGEVLEIHLELADQTKELLALVKPDATEISASRFNEIVVGIMYPIKYEPSLGVVNGIISSGDLSLISNYELKYMISSLTGRLDNYEYWAKVRYDKHINVDYPFLLSRYPIKDMLYGGDIHIQGSKFESDQLPLLTSLEFESIVDLRFVNAVNLSRLAKDIQDLQGKLLILIEEDLNK
jgi:hypothetical protein